MAVGKLYINGVDAYTAYGTSLEREGVDALMAFGPMKEPVVNKNPTADGAEVISTTVGRADERTVSLLMHIVAGSKSEFLQRRAALYSVLKSGSLAVKYADDKDVDGAQLLHTMYYLSCTQYTQFLSGMAKFVLSLYEPNPPAVEQND